jgi:chromosome segregation ATPase
LNNAEELMSDDEKLIDIIDDVIMQALNAARREADALRLQQQLQIAELDDLKKDIESLRRAEGELNESDDKVKELVMENKNIKEQVTLLQERLRKLQVEDSAKASELQAIKRDMEEIHNKNTNNSRHSPEIAKLQVQLRNAQLQEELHREDNVNLRKQIETAIKVKTEYEKKLNSLQATQDALIADYNRLENLHHLLGADYDRTKVELMQLKQRIKVERMNGSELSTREKMHIEATLRNEREESQKILREAENEISRLQKELSDFRRENCAMLRNTDERSDELRRLRVAECSQKSTINSLNGTIQQLNHVLSGKEMEIATLRRQVDMLRQYNGDENQSLIKQIELLLVKNQELHERSLNDKDTFHALQRDLQEQLVTLRRNKEKLEEKIMDQYKSMDSRKIKEKQTLMKRAAKALMPKATTRKAIQAPPPNGSTTEDSSIDETHGSFVSPPPPAAAVAALPTTTTSASSSNGQSSSSQTTITSHSATTQPIIKPETDSAVHRFFRRSSLLRRTNPLPRRSNEPSSFSSLPTTTSAPINNNNLNTALPPLSPKNNNNQYASLRIKNNPIISSQLLQSPNGVGCCGLPQRRAPIAAIDDEIGIIKGRPSSAYENA